MDWPRTLDSHRRLALIWPVCTLALLSPSDAGPHHAPLDGLPSLMLWAWERPEDLRGLDETVGVAYLAQTITLSGDQISLQPRRQPLRVSTKARLMAVTRIEVPPTGLTPAEATLDVVATLIAKTRTAPRVAGLQIDFDARASERDYYRRLLDAVRAQVGSTPLTITALASWCVGDRWMENLPVDEAVPMLFRMGPEDALYRGLAGSPRLGATTCQGAVGVSLDEPLGVERGKRRLYVFGPRSWNTHTVADAKRQAGRSR